jgi:serine protease Do
MTHFLRPYQYLEFAALAAMGAGAVFMPHSAPAQTADIMQILEAPSPLLSAASSQGYLGVLVGDVDADSAAKLKLKDVRGAVITLIDHDAPAGQVGLKVNDVVLELNGQAIEGAEQLRRMLHEIPPGRKVTLVISRDGVTQTLATEMGDHKKIVEGFWTKIGTGGDIFPSSGPGMTLLPGGDLAGGSGWKFSIFASSLKIGAMVEPLTSQMAEYLGVSSGLMVKQVARKTEADAAGLKAFDVILKVGTESISTMADWERALHSNQGKPVQLTILRDKKQQTLTLQVDSKHNKGELEMEELFPSDDCPLLAELQPDSDRIWDAQLDPDAAQILQFDSSDASSAARSAADDLRKQAESLRDQLKVDPKLAEEMRKQAEALRDQLKTDGIKQFEFSDKQAEEMRKSAQALRDQLKANGFKQFEFSEKQAEEMRKQAEQLRDSMKDFDFKLDQKQLDQFNHQMDQWQQQFKPEIFELSPQWN